MPRDKDRYDDTRDRDRDRGVTSYRDRRGDDYGDKDKDRDRERGRDRKRRHDSSNSRERVSSRSDYKDSRDSRKKEHRSRVNMSYDDEEDEGDGERANGGPVDAEKIKPNVEENKGEISMSVEETNRVRAMLGLKPLNVGGSAKPTAEEVAVENMRQKREEERQAQELKDVEARLEKVRRKRQLNEKLKGVTLGEIQDGEQEAFSAADWVKRNRQKSKQLEEERLLAVQRARIVEEQDEEMEMAGEDEKKGSKQPKYESDNLAGLKVTHGAEAFEAGDSVILTLKDQGILEEDEHGKAKGLADHEDELENVHMKETERRQELDKEAIRAKRGAYQAYDDEEFEGEIGPGAKRKVLSHYDEVKKEGARLTLGEGGTAKEGVSKSGVSGSGAGGEEKQKVLESLKVETKDASEYYTTEEMAKFKKPKKMRRKKLRKREEAGASSSLGLEAAIDESTRHGATAASGNGSSSTNGAATNGAAGGGGGDHGSRAARAARNIADSGEAEDKRARFDSALAKADARAKEKLADSYAKPSDKSRDKIPPPPPPEEPMPFAEELDTDLGLSLARARRLAQLKEKAQARKSRDVGEVRREAMRRKVKIERGAEDVAGNGNGVSMHANAGGVPVKEEDEGMVFTSTTEFSSRLEATLQERKRNNIAAAEKQKIKEEREMEAKNAKHKNRDSMDVDRKDDEEEGEDQTKIDKKKKSQWTTKRADDDEMDEDELEEMLEQAEKDSDDDEQLAFLHKQPLAKNGMAATLALLRPSGVLQDKFHRSGRAKDARKHHGEEDETREERESGAKLEYRDEWGRALTRKEAWRNLNYQFHGFGSGKKKQEKRLKQVEEEKKKQQAMDLQRLKTLQQTQEMTKQAFVVVQGGSHVGAALPPPPPSLDLKKKAQAAKKEVKVKSETPAG